MMKNIVNKMAEAVGNWFKRRWDDYNEDFKKHGGL
jgi:hypothetical protein